MNSHENDFSASVTICNNKGLHARASAAFVKCASQFDADIFVTRERETVSGGSIMELLMLAAGKGTPLTISATGPQAEEAVTQLAMLVSEGFYEDDEE